MIYQFLSQITYISSNTLVKISEKRPLKTPCVQNERELNQNTSVDFKKMRSKQIRFICRNESHSTMGQQIILKPRPSWNVWDS